MVVKNIECIKSISYDQSEIISNILQRFVMNEAIKVSFYPKDLFILLAKNRIVADWQVKNQKNARKYHSYFWVFEKSDKKIEYI